MLTVKHIEDSGHETLTPATRVTFTPSSCNMDGDTEHPHGDFRMFGVPDPHYIDGSTRYTKGRIYVMNAAGKTVAHYDLRS